MAGQSRTLKLSILADIDNLKKNLNSGSNEVEGFGGKLGGFAKKAGAAFAVAGAAAAAYAGTLLIDGVKSAIEDEAAQAKLATTLENVTGATTNQIKAVEDYITQTALANGITDDKLRPSLDRLVRSTQNVEEAQKLQTLALDIAAGTGKDLQAVSEALAKAHDGNLGALKKLGVGIDENIIKSKDFDAATAALAATFEGQASQQAETFQGKMARLSVAFDEAKETVGSYVLDALTPLISGFVDKGIPAIQDVAENLGKTLGPAFAEIFKVVKEDLLPVLITWWKFLYEEVIPAIGSVVGPILQGLKNAFDTIKKALQDNSEELQPFYDFLKKIWEFIKEYLAPLLGGAFKKALEIIGDIVGGLVDGFANLVGFISDTVTKIKEFVNFIKNNPISQFFFGGDNSKSLKTSTSLQTGGGGGGGGGGSKAPFVYVPNIVTSKQGGTRDIGVYSAGDQAAILRSIALQNETERLRQQRATNAAARLAATGGLSTAERIVINVNAASVIDEEGFSRAVTDALNNSTYRGTNGALNLVGIG